MIGGWMQKGDCFFMKKKIILVASASLILLGGCEWFSKEERTKKEHVLNTNIVIPITSESHFNAEVIESEKPVVAKFGTVWCGACQVLKPVYKEAANEYKNRVKFVEIDADQLKNLVTEYNIQGYPTLLFFKNGKKVKEVVGSMKVDDLKAHVEEVLR
jgi:thioredoxin 1